MDIYTHLVRVAEVDEDVEHLPPEVHLALEQRVGLVDEEHAAESPLDHRPRVASHVVGVSAEEVGFARDDELATP